MEMIMEKKKRKKMTTMMKKKNLRVLMIKMKRMRRYFRT
jgi:hypothetical protein